VQRARHGVGADQREDGGAQQAGRVAPPDRELQDEGGLAVGAFVEHAVVETPGQHRGGAGHGQVGDDVDRRVHAGAGTGQEEVDGDVAAVELAERQEGQHRKGGPGLHQFEVAGDRPQAREDEAASDDADDGQDQHGNQRHAPEHRGPEGDAFDGPINP
jgi:hypothetical protein